MRPDGTGAWGQTEVQVNNLNLGLTLATKAQERRLCGAKWPEKGHVASGKSSMIVHLLSQGQDGYLLEGAQGRAMQEAEDRLGVAGQYAPTLGITYQAVGQANETLGTA